MPTLLFIAWKLDGRDRDMKSHLANAFFGVVDYLAYPVGLLLLAPVILRALGMVRYGIWAVATAAISTGAIIASGFGDANIRAVAIKLANGNRKDLINTVRCALGIHLLLGVAIAVIGWFAASWMTRHIVQSSPELTVDCLWSLRIAGLLALIRAIETVCVSTQRAFSRYGSAIQISVVARLLGLMAVGLVPFYLRSVSALLFVSLTIGMVALWFQMKQLNNLLGISFVLPAIRLETTRSLLVFGGFTWLCSVAGLLFGQADRLVAGVGFGATAVSAYAFCVQLTQPIYGISAAGLHFLFPYLTTQLARNDMRALRRGVLITAAANASFVLVALSTLLFCGAAILRLWAGDSIVSAGSSLLAPIAWSSAFSALGVTGCYSMLAMGRAGTVTAFNVAGGLAMTGAIVLLVPHYGLAGIANGRLFFGPTVLLVYLPLLMALHRKSEHPVAATGISVCEEV
jgi:O-antigen/teichoic acid export membrane protein